MMAKEISKLGAEKLRPDVLSTACLPFASGKRKDMERSFVFHSIWACSKKIQKPF